jgi:Protein of unknown function (DUF4232)
MSDPRLDHHFDQLRHEAAAMVRPPGLDGARRTARRRRAALVGASAVLAAIAIGVPVAVAGGDRGTGPADEPAPTPPAPSATAPATAPASAPPAPPTPTASGHATSTTVPTCTDLALSYVGSDGAAGTRYAIYRLRNTGQLTCDLTGYPGVSYLDAAGREVQRDAVRETVAPAPRTVTLRPGAAVYFEVSNSTVAPNIDCPGNRAAVTLRVYPPDNTRALFLPGTYEVCTPRVRPVHAP